MHGRIKVSFVARAIITLLLIFGVFLETGPLTALALLLIALFAEVVSVMVRIIVERLEDLEKTIK